jgi:hypothetical protein
MSHVSALIPKSDVQVNDAAVDGRLDVDPGQIAGNAAFALGHRFDSALW